MTDVKFNAALIVGAGSGLSASLARALAKDGIKVALAARTTGDLDPLVKETGARAFTCDASKRGEVEKLFADLDATLGAPDIVVYNASFRTRGPFVELDPLDVEKALAVTAYGGFLVAQAAARRMLPKKHGAILLTGASRRVRGGQGLAPVGTLRHGQVRAARPRPEHGARAFAAGHPRRSRRDRRRHQERAPRGVRRSSRQPARPRRHRRELYAPHPSGAQRLGVGDRAAAVGGEILTASDRKERTMTDKVTIPALLQMKRDGRKSVGVVAWDYQIARIADRAGVDIVSVGDSVGVNLWGHSNPLEVTMDEMLVVCKAVRRGVTRALVSCDFPYGPLQEGSENAVRAAIRLVKEGGADMVKLDGAADFPETVRALTRAGIPVFAQFGITPQTALRYGIPYG